MESERLVVRLYMLKFGCVADNWIETMDHGVQFHDENYTALALANKHSLVAGGSDEMFIFAASRELLSKFRFD